MSIVPRTLLLAAALALLCLPPSLGYCIQADTGLKRPPQVTMKWVHTAHGWEKPVAWNPPPGPQRRLHPFVVAAAQLLGSVFVLVAFAPEPAVQLTLAEVSQRLGFRRQQAAKDAGS